MTKPIEYRLATSADALAVAALHAKNWRQAYRGNFRDEYLDGDIFSERRGVWVDRLSHPPANQFVCVAVDDARIVGFICAFGAHDTKWGSFIDNLHVDAEVQRRGIGTALMRQAGTWLASTYGGEQVYLLVWESNPARILYDRLGGRNAGIVEVENPGGGIGRYFRYVWGGPYGLAG